MRKNRAHFLTVAVIVFALGTFVTGEAKAGSKDLEATKKTKFEDENYKSMQDVLKERDQAEDAYMAKMSANSDKMVLLLTEIKTLLSEMFQEQLLLNQHP